MPKATLTQLINECASLVAGACIGADIRVQQDGTIKQTATESSVCLVRRGYRCRYFEAKVLPLVQSSKELAGADGPYRFRNCMADPEKAGAELRDHPFFVSGPRVVKGDSGYTCSSCGGARPKGRQYCVSCAQQRKRETARRRATRYRKTRGVA